jgi:putative FmdB family regulatory protein
MPLFEYRCNCGWSDEYVRKYEVSRRPVTCPKCAGSAKRVLPAPANTPGRWGDTPWAYHDRGLGIDIHSKNHRRQVMKDQGLREIAPGEVEAEQARCSREHDKHEADMSTYQRVLADTGSQVTAMAQTFPDVEV